MDYTITMYLNQYWRDERLKFSDNSETSYALTGDFAEQIWVPDTFLANDKSSFLHDVTEKNKMVRLYGNGSLVYGMRSERRKCIDGYTMENIILYWLNHRNAVSGVEDVTLPQFTLSEYETLNKIEKLLTGDYQRLSLTFKLDRNIGYFIFQTYLPSILIVMLSWVSFWINHDATSARVALGITTVLTMTTISNGVRSSLPRISYVKAIDIYLVMCFVFVFAALLEYAAVNYTYWTSKGKQKTMTTVDRSESSRRDCNDFRSKLFDEKEEGNEDNVRRQEKSHAKEILQMKLRFSPMMEVCQKYSSIEDLDDDPSNLDMPIDRKTLRTPALVPATRRQTRDQSLPACAVSRRRKEKKKFCDTHSDAYAGQRLQLSNIKDRARSIRVKLPRVHYVNTIDRYARFFFPVLFVLFNVSYWTVYLFA